MLRAGFPKQSDLACGVLLSWLLTAYNSIYSRTLRDQFFDFFIYMFHCIHFLSSKYLNISSPARRLEKQSQSYLSQFVQEKYFFNVPLSKICRSLHQVHLGQSQANSIVEKKKCPALQCVLVQPNSAENLLLFSSMHVVICLPHAVSNIVSF